MWGTSRDPREADFSGWRRWGSWKINVVSMHPDRYDMVYDVVSRVRPDEVYNFAAQSSVGVSFNEPHETILGITLGTLNLLEAIREIDKDIRYFNPGSSESFGDPGEVPIDEGRIHKPTNPYGVAKASASETVSLYRQTYGLFACTGILFNHESPLRSPDFVTKNRIRRIRIAAGSRESSLL